MNFQKQTFRPLFFVFLLICLLSGLTGVVRVPVNAAPLAQIATNVVISEFRTTGPSGGTDEFVEIFNPTNSSINLTGWKIKRSSGCGATINTPFTFPATSIASGQHVLITGTGYSGLTAFDFSVNLGVADDGGIAITNAVDIPIDQVGMCSTTTYREGTTLAPLSGTANQSYERGNNGCTDTNNNATDFIWNQTTSNPENSSNIPIPSPCLGVIDVTSTVADATYQAGAVIPIQITFNNNVNVDITGGVPTLLLESGTIDRPATYSSGDGTPTLTFNYTVQANDASGDLDYVATNSLSLNGGTITGAVGNADLTLPSPGTPGSLGINKAIVIDNQTGPTVTINQASTQIDPTGIFPINFTVVFSEPINVSSFTTADVTQNGTATGVSWSITDSGDHMSFTLSATAATGTGTLIPSIAANQVTDLVGDNNTASASTDNRVVYQNISPTVTIEQATSQADPTGGTPINFTVVFSEAMNASSFTTADITQNGTATGITWRIVDSGDHTTFSLSAIAITAAGTTTIEPSILPNRVTNVAGNGNAASTSTDNSVTFNNALPPTVTINQAVGQLDPTATLPINFTVVFSEAIIASIFTTTDITQNGTATGVTWSITDLGDHTIFTLSATAVSGFGTLVPSIAANRVTDLIGNNNTASTSTDNIVTYLIPTITPSGTPTATSTPTSSPTPVGFLTVLINEVAWMGTGASSTDEWIELYNPSTTVTINLAGWVLKGDDNSPNIVFPAGKSIPPRGFFLLERTSDNAVIDDGMNPNSKLVYTGELSNSFEVLRLYDASNRLIDTANSNGGNWPAGMTSSTTHGTMERRSVVADSDTAWFTNVSSATWTKHDSRGISSTNFLIHGTPGYSNWAVSVTATPSPIPTKTSVPTAFRTTTPTFPPPPPLIGINEFVPRPAHDWNSDGVVNVGDEYIELINHGVIDVNLSGYTLDDEANIGSAPFRLPSVTLKPGERMVFYGKDTGLLLSDGGDGVRLNKPNGQLGDAYNYTVVKFPDQSYCRLPDNGGLDDWNQNCFPTPGLKNSLSGSFTKPPTQGDDDLPLCPISDTLPIDFVWAECPSFGNIWSRFYWDAKGWFGEKNIPDLDSKWDVYVD